MNMSIESNVPLANPRHRLGAAAVDVGLIFVTSFIGWLIWSLIIWRKGQTPGKSIVKIRVLNEPTGTPATWGQMFKRQALISWGLLIPYWVAYLVTLVVAGPPDTLATIIYLLMYFFYLALVVTDVVWVFGPTRRRLMDYWAGTIVVNEADSARQSA
jgi:uncharacterized RDD family membrane protein YckC